MVSLHPENELGDTMFNLVDGIPNHPTVNTDIPQAFIVQPGDKVLKARPQSRGIRSLVSLSTDKMNLEARSRANFRQGALSVSPTTSSGMKAKGGTLTDHQKLGMRGMKSPDEAQHPSLRVVNFPGSASMGGSEGGLSGERAEKLSLALRWSQYNSSKSSLSVCLQHSSPILCYTTYHWLPITFTSISGHLFVLYIQNELHAFR